MSERFLTVKEAAAELGIAVSTAYDLVTARRLRAHRFGNAVRISRADLEWFIKRSVE